MTTPNAAVNALSSSVATLSTRAAAAAAAAVTTTEISLQCADGIQLAAQLWTKTTTKQTTTTQKQSSSSSEQPQQQSESSTAASAAFTKQQQQQPPYRILCLHGWMDNCRSFDLLAPALVEQLPSADAHGTQLVALDFVGHGWSSHKSVDAPPTQLAEHVFYVHQVVQQLGWVTTTTTSSRKTTATTNGDDSTSTTSTEPKPSASSASTTNTFTLIGHSMGAAVSCLYAAAFPEHVQQLILLEGAGPLNRPAADVAQHVRNHVTRRSLQLSQPNGNDNNNKMQMPRIYPNLAQAVAVRCRTAQNFPGNQWLSQAAATALVERGTRRVVVGNEDHDTTSSSAAAAGVQFRHDPRLQWPSMQYYTAEQVEAVYRSIAAASSRRNSSNNNDNNISTVAVLLAEHGWPVEEEQMARALELLQPTHHAVLPGSHHFHADPETVDTVAQHVLDILLSSVMGQRQQEREEQEEE